LAIPVTQVLKYALKKMKLSECHVDLRNALIKRLEEYFEDLKKESNFKEQCIATALDPRFKLNYFFDEKVQTEVKNDVIKNILEMAIAENSDTLSETSVNSIVSLFLLVLIR